MFEFKQLLLNQYNINDCILFRLQVMKQADHIDRLIAKWKREAPEYDLAPVEVIGRAGRIMEFVDRALESKFEEFGISRASFDVLATLRRAGPPYRLLQRDLMQSLLRTSGSISVRIDALEREELVRREQHEEDRRSTFVALTEKGSKLLQSIIPEHLANESALVAGLNLQERKELTVLLRKWLAALEEDGASMRQVHLGMVVLPPKVSLLKRRAVGLSDQPGLLVHFVEPESIADMVGIQKGDLLVAVEDEEISSLMALRKTLNKPKPQKKKLQIFRGVTPVTLTLQTKHE